MGQCFQTPIVKPVVIIEAEPLPTYSRDYVVRNPDELCNYITSLNKETNMGYFKCIKMTGSRKIKHFPGQQPKREEIRQSLTMSFETVDDLSNPDPDFPDAKNIETRLHIRIKTAHERGKTWGTRISIWKHPVNKAADTSKSPDYMNKENRGGSWLDGHTMPYDLRSWVQSHFSYHAEEVLRCIVAARSGVNAVQDLWIVKCLITRPKGLDSQSCSSSSVITTGNVVASS